MNLFKKHPQICILNWSWAIYFFLIIITGSVNLSVNKWAHLYSLIFVLVVNLSYWLLSSRFQKIEQYDKTLSKAAGWPSFSGKIWWALFVIYLLSICFHFYDKVYVMNLDYAGGICKAKLEWIRHGASRGGEVSSVWSVLGHLGSSLFFVFTYEWIRRSRRLVDILYYLALFLYLLYCASIGNRSSIILFLFFALSVIILYRYQFRQAIVKILPTLVLIVGFVFYIFMDRARCENYQQSITELSLQQVNTYKNSFQKSLNFTSDSDWIDQFWQSHQVLSLTQLSIYYITHTQNVFAEVINTENRPGQNLINSLVVWVKKAGIDIEPQARSFQGRLLHLPGSFYYSYGLIGMIIGSLLFGLLLVFTNRLNCYFFDIHILVLLTCFLSPLSSPANFIMFPSILIALAVLFLLKKWLYHK